MKERKSIYETGFGWVSPRGNVLGCEMHDHLADIGDWIDVKELAPGVEKLVEGVEETKASCQALEDDGEHPEWHCYEIELTRASGKSRELLYQAGFIRLGRNGFMKVLEVEGVAQRIQDRMATIRHVLKEYNAENRVDFTLRVSPIKP